MSLGPVMVDVGGPELTADERELLRQPAVGGIILFSRNYRSLDQLQALLAAIHELRRPPLLVAVDHEGGRVQRFREGFTLIPPAAYFGTVYESDPDLGTHLAELAGWLMAAELRAVGVDISFAPVLDLNRGVSTVIGERAFHRDPEAVTALGRAFVGGMHRAGMAATGKHFPGHGAVEADSHLAVVVDQRPFATIYQEDLVPFRHLIEHGIDAIMPAHVVFSEADELPAGFSRFWLQDVLRERLGFQGVIFSDDLSMAGADIGGDYPDRAHAALDAGCDMVLACNNPGAAAALVEALGESRDPQSQLRLVRMHGRPAPDPVRLRRSRAWRDAVAALRGGLSDPTPQLDLS